MSVCTKKVLNNSYGHMYNVFENTCGNNILPTILDFTNLPTARDFLWSFKMHYIDHLPTTRHSS